MTRCFDEGTLRGFVDAALTAELHAAVAAHLPQCPACQARLDAVASVAARMHSRLGDVPPPDAAAALRRFKAGVSGAETSTRRPPASSAGRTWTTFTSWRNTTMNSLLYVRTGAQRRIAGGVAAALVALSLLLLPPVRAAADQLLQIFRVQSVVFVPLDPARLQQLDDLEFDAQTLFVAKPEIVNDPAPPQTVGSVDAAAPLVGFAPRQPAALPGAPVSTEAQVIDRQVAQFQVNVAASRQLLALMGVEDVTLPDALGDAPIVADLAPALETHYAGTSYDLTLIQGTSPTVQLPEGVDLQQLGTAALRLLGMDADRAAELSRTVDWSSTFIFPFPANLDDVRQVTIGDASGLLVGGGDDYHLYWQDGDRFFIMQGSGMEDGEMLAAAESVQ